MRWCGSKRPWPASRARWWATLSLVAQPPRVSTCLKVGVLSKRIDHPDLQYQPFFEDRVILIAPADHPWAEYGKALPTDLLDQPLIVREPTAGTQEVMLEALKHHGIERSALDIVMELGNAEAIEMAVEQGIGVAFISELAAARGLALGRVREVKIEGLDLRRTIYIARNTCCPLTRAHDRFWNFVAEERNLLVTEVWGEFDHLELEWRSGREAPADPQIERLGSDSECGHHQEREEGAAGKLA